MPIICRVCKGNGTRYQGYKGYRVQSTGYRIHGCIAKGVQGVHDKFIGKGLQGTGYWGYRVHDTEYRKGVTG